MTHPRPPVSAGRPGALGEPRGAERARVRRPSRLSTALLATLLTAGGVSTGVLLAGPALAEVPAFPDNIVVFPNRDFVTVEGFGAAAGQDVRVEIRRGGVVIGSATGMGASAAQIAAGTPILEVNHPGGICWGAGGGLQVTPDIRAGDVVVVTAAGVTRDTTVQDAEVTGSSVSGSRLTVTGHVASGINTDFLEQRIINPDMKDDPTIGRRDVRAVTGGLVAAPRGNYSSGLAVSGTSATATYEFGSNATAELARAGGLRMMSWQNTDADGNRQGITISEFGELGGPGFGGCPAGAVNQGPQSPTSVSATQSGGNVSVSWTPATQNPGTEPVQGWTVRLVEQTSQGGVQAETGVRLSDPGATTASLPGTLAGHRVEVRAVTTAGESWPPAVNGVSRPPGSTDTTPPTVSASPRGGTFTSAQTVTLSTNETGAQIYYTTDGSSPLDVAAGTTGLTSTRYPGTPITIAPPATGSVVVLKFAAIDNADNTSAVVTETYTFGSAAAPVAPAVGTVTAGSGTATVNWTAPTNPGSSAITGYVVTATPTGTGGPISMDALPSATTATLTGLTNGTTYSVTVAAVNAVGRGPASVPVSVTPTVPAVDALTITRAQWKAGDFRIEGTGTRPGATVSVRAGGPTGPVIGTATVAAPVAPATTGVWTLRIRTGPAATTRPANVYVTSDGGGQIGPVTLN